MTAAGNNGRRGGHSVNVSGQAIRGLRDLTKDQLSKLLQEAHREYTARFPHGRPPRMPTGVNRITSTELALVAFWVLNGLPLVGIEPNPDARASNHQASVFVLADWEGQADRLRREFTNGRFAQYDGILRGLKKEAVRYRDRNRRRG